MASRVGTTKRRGITANVLLRRREISYSHYPHAVARNSFSYDSGTSEEISTDDEDSDDQETDIGYDEAASNLLANYINKALLLLTVSVNVIFRSLPSPEFRAISIAWAVILPFTSDISLDEGVFPALVATSLGYDNSVVARNLYISIARSRLGLFALVLLALYSKNYYILTCGVLLRVLMRFSLSLLQRSIPKSEATLICGALVNVVFHLRPTGEFYDPAAIIACGLVAALPCYPLFARFVRVFKATRGNKSQWSLVASIYISYLLIASYLYFGLYGVKPTEVLRAIADNSDMLLYWAGLLSAGLAIALLFGMKLGLDGRRKLWHLCAVCMFLPEWVRQRDFTKVCLAVAIVLFVALEACRATALPPFGIPLHRALQSFVDHRDKRGPMIISHIYLLLGISVPIFLANSPAGVVCLGIGDTVASQVGRRFGRIRIFGHKSLEGCLGFAVATGLSLSYFTSFKHVWRIAVPTALLEAVTPLNDNLVVPMFMLSLEELLNR